MNTRKRIKVEAGTARTDGACNACTKDEGRVTVITLRNREGSPLAIEFRLCDDCLREVFRQAVEVTTEHRVMDYSCGKCGRPLTRWPTGDVVCEVHGTDWGVS